VVQANAMPIAVMGDGAALVAMSANAAGSRFKNRRTGDYSRHDSMLALSPLVQLRHQAPRQSPNRIFNAAPGSSVVNDLLRFSSWPGSIEDIHD
jgi:hypothetical protein